MSNLSGTDFVHYTPQGIFFYESSSAFIPSVSQSSLPLITQITCSADLGNNLAVTSSLSKFFAIPLISGSPSNTTLIPSQLNVIYNTGSFFAVSSSNTTNFYQPTSSDTIINYNLNVSIEKNDSANVVASKTYNAITGSMVYTGTSYNYISASLIGSAITIFNTFSQSLSGFDVVISAPNMTANIIQSGSFGSGSITNYTAPKGTVPTPSASLVIGRDADDTTQSSFIFKVQSGSFGGSEDRDILYISASEGKLGLGTTDPLADVDIRANDFQIQRKTERRGLKVNTEGNIESFDRSINATTATTGSEFILRYSRGITITPGVLASFGPGTLGSGTGSDNASALEVFNGLSADFQAKTLANAEAEGNLEPPQVGDVLGSIRWITDSGSIDTLDSRVTGEAALIQGKVKEADATGVGADLIFSVASKTAGAAQKFLIGANDRHQVTGSLEVSSGIVVRDDVTVDDVLTVKGQTILGDADTDTHTFTGNVTASNNVSASGQVFEGTLHYWEASALTDTGDDSHWQAPPSKGIFDGNTWNVQLDDFYDGTADITTARTQMNAGWKIPDTANYSCSIKSMDIYIAPARNITFANDDNFSCSLWYSKNADIKARQNVDTSAGFTQRHAATVTGTQCGRGDGSTPFVKFNNYYVSQSINLELEPGSVLYPVIKTFGTNNFNNNIYWIVSYCKIPL